MFFVDIDIAKLDHFAVAISSESEIILEPFKFTNDSDGFQQLISKLQLFDKNSIISLESTAHYNDSLRFVSFFNPNMMYLNALKHFLQRTVMNRTRLIIQLTFYADQIFLGIHHVFKYGLHQYSGYALIKQAHISKEIASMHMTHLANLLKVNSHEHFTKEQTKEIGILA